MSLQEHESESSTERWTVSYADFMTLLFALFVVLFASSHHEKHDIQQVSSAVKQGFQQLGAFPAAGVNSAARTSDAGPVLVNRSAGVDVIALQRDLTSALGKEIARNEVVLRMTPDGFVISLHELGFFRSGEATLLADATGKMQRIASVLMKYGLDMRVEGHTDNLPIHTLEFNSNWDLSIARATNVAMMLIDDGHFNPARLSIAGYGQYHPVTTNDTPLGRQSNRRVDIVIVTATKMDNE
ncbi:OmpA/MotB family protein [Granulicella paludicola]|uniref:OmpA/MotB family protein n=1 Tax=Granulicella paludicola TaxID=474951 RepID=UPI0021E0E5E5|nr:OmpA family protein [Granulicella paludicola]